MHAGIAAALPGCLCSIRGGRRPARPRARNHHPQEPAHLGADHRASGALGRPPVPRLRLGAERAGAKARADRPGEQHRVAEALDEHGAHARLALGSGAGCVRVRRRRRPKRALAQRVPRHEEADGGDAHRRSAWGEPRHRRCVSISAGGAKGIPAEIQQRPVPMVRGLCGWSTRASRSGSSTGTSAA